MVRGDLIGLGGTAHRDPVGQIARPLGLAALGVDTRFDDAGADRDDADAFGRDLFGQPLGQRVKPGLGRSIVDILACRPQTRSNPMRH